MLVDVGDDVVSGVSFSPDGSRIAYLYGGGDNDHHVWIARADGTDSHEVLADVPMLEIGHAHGLAWSPAGDRIALGFEGSIYTFAPDGSGFVSAFVEGERLVPFWSPDGSQLQTKGPWHPAPPAGSMDVQAP